MGDTEEWCDMGTDANGCWMGNWCQPMEQGGCPDVNMVSKRGAMEKKQAMALTTDLTMAQTTDLTAMDQTMDLTMDQTMASTMAQALTKSCIEASNIFQNFMIE